MHAPASIAGVLLLVICSVRCAYRGLTASKIFSKLRETFAHDCYYAFAGLVG